MNEPVITVNGVTLNDGQVATLRAAICTLDVDIHDEEIRRKIGDDLANAYAARLRELYALMRM